MAAAVGLAWWLAGWQLALVVGHLRGGVHGLLVRLKHEPGDRPGLRVVGFRAAGHRRRRGHRASRCRTGSSSSPPSALCSSWPGSAAPSTAELGERPRRAPRRASAPIPGFLRSVRSCCRRRSPSPPTACGPSSAPARSAGGHPTRSGSSCRSSPSCWPFSTSSCASNGPGRRARGPGPPATGMLQLLGRRLGGSLRRRRLRVTVDAVAGDPTAPRLPRHHTVQRQS